MSLRRLSDVFALLVSGISLLVLILVYQNEILGFIQQYSEAVITFGVVLVYLVSLAAILYFARNRRIKRNKLRGNLKECVNGSDSVTFLRTKRA